MRSKGYEEVAYEAEEILKLSISEGDPVQFLKGYRNYEKVILYLESLGKAKEVRLLLNRLTTILQVVVDNGKPDGAYMSKLGPYFILYAHHFKAKIFEVLNVNLLEAVTARVGALDFAQGMDWVEQILNIVINLLIEGQDDASIKYLKFIQSKKEELTEEILVQLNEISTKRKFGIIKTNHKLKHGVEIYDVFLKLLGLMIKCNNEGKSILTEGTPLLSKLKRLGNAELNYVEQRLLALEAQIRGYKQDFVDEKEKSHVMSQIIPHTIMGTTEFHKLAELMKKYISNLHGLDIPVSVGSIPILGANPAGSPHLSIVGQTGVGKTTLTKQIIKENIRVQETSVIVFDYHLEYGDIADTIIQFGGKERKGVNYYFPVDEISSVYKQAQDFIRNQQITLAQTGFTSEDLAQKMKTLESDTRPGVTKFVEDVIESLLDQFSGRILELIPGDITVVWIFSEEPYLIAKVISTIIKRILRNSIQNKSEHKTIIVTEEAQNLKEDQWLRNLTSEGRKFGLFLISISQHPEFDSWVVSNSDTILFKLKRNPSENSEIGYLTNAKVRNFLPNLDIGEYLSYHKLHRSWVYSFNPESLSPIHAKETLKNKIKQLQQLIDKG